MCWTQSLGSFRQLNSAAVLFFSPTQKSHKQQQASRGAAELHRLHLRRRSKTGAARICPDSASNGLFQRTVARLDTADALAAHFAQTRPATRSTNEFMCARVLSAPRARVRLSRNLEPCALLQQSRPACRCIREGVASTRPHLFQYGSSFFEAPLHSPL